MTTNHCPQLSLVEALRDGRLGPQERASVERHVAVCTACRSLATDLARIGEAVRAPLDPATPLEHQRARQALLRRATQFNVSSAPPGQLPASVERRRLALVSIVAAAALIALGIGWLGGRVTAPSERALAALHFHMHPRLEAAPETTIRPSDDARFERTKADALEVVTLTSGALDLTVRRLEPGERFVVRTSDAEIEVRARALHIEADQGRIRGVSVAEGTVEVRYADFSAVIPSGGSWRATGDLTPAPPAAGPSTTAVARATPAPARERQHVVEAPAVEEAAPLAPSAAPSAAPTAAPVSREFAEAMQAIARHDYDGAASQLEAFSSAHASDPRSDEADYLRAIALQRAGRAADARAAASRYLAAHPQGAHRVEAQAMAGR